MIVFQRTPNFSIPSRNGPMTDDYANGWKEGYAEKRERARHTRAGILSPLIFGALMDHGEPRLVFFVIAAGSLLAILTVASVPRRRAD